MTYFHSCTIEGLGNFLNNFNSDLEICTSSENSDELFGRECVIEFENPDAKLTQESSCDIDDNGRFTNHDEQRWLFSSLENFLDSISNVYIKEETHDSLLEGSYESYDNGELTDDDLDFLYGIIDGQEDYRLAADLVGTSDKRNKFFNWN
jgi:hypothetical protein